MGKLTLIYDSSRDLRVMIPRRTPVSVRASHESSNARDKRTSKTWRFDHGGKKYRVQIQVTEDS